MRLTGYVYIYKSDATMSKSLGVFTDDATKKNIQIWLFVHLIYNM